MMSSNIIPKYYKEIPGWFHASELYSFVFAKYCTQKSLFVEIGSYFGRSSCYMCELIRNNLCNIQFDIIDPWIWNNLFEITHDKIQKGQRVYAQPFLEKEHEKIVNKFGKNPHDITCYYLNKFNLIKDDKIINLIQKTSKDASFLYEDNTIDFLYIDGDHSLKIVEQDIKTYFPKVKVGGIISGDDYNAIKPVVDKIFGLEGLMSNNKTWWVIKK